MGKLDDFLDAADKVVDGYVGTMKNAHYPGKEYDDPIPDAVIVKETTSVLFGAVQGPEGKGNYWHAFHGVSNRTLCARSIDPAKITQRKKPNNGATDFYIVCFGCISKLTAFETQAPSELKELTSG